MTETPLRTPILGNGLPMPEVLEFIESTPGQVQDAIPEQRVQGVQATATIPPVEWHGNRQNCIVNVYASARLAWFRRPGESMHLGLLVTINGDIHNPHVVQSIKVPFSVQVMLDGAQVDDFARELYAPAVLDPAGSDKWYYWTPEAENVEAADLVDLSRFSLGITI